MTREEATKWLKLLKTSPLIYGEYPEAIDMAIEALSAEEAVWNEYEAEFTDLPDIPRYYYEKVVGKMAHEINVLKEQLESADAVQAANLKEEFESAIPNCQKCAIKELWEETEKEDLVSVVRCEDCRHRDLFSCPLADNDFQKDDDYCSWGERREPTE